MKIVHHYAYSCFDLLISGHWNVNPSREAISMLSGKHKRFMFVHPVGESYFLLRAFPVFFIKYCHNLCTQRQIVVRWKHVSYLLYGKYLKKEFLHSLSTLILDWIKLESFVMQLKRQSVEAWQNEKLHSKENNTSENPIPRQEIFKPIDHVKYES